VFDALQTVLSWSDTFQMFLWLVGVSSLACIAVALWGIMVALKQAVALLERIVNLIVKAVKSFSRFKV
jgi:type III secretory pathway component EscS